MSRLHISARHSFACVVGVALLCGILAGVTGEDVFAASHRVRGQFASTVVTEGCLSPVGICTHGTLTGGVNADFDFIATGLIATADTPTTGVVLYTGDIELTTRFGSLSCKDTGAVRSTGSGAVASVCAITGGTGQLAGATGEIQFVGNFTFGVGGEGEYRAVINLP